MIFLSLQSCSPCPAGYSCLDASIAPTIDSVCRRGTYSVTGWPECIECPAGYACPSIFGKGIITCALGTYSLDMSTVSVHCMDQVYHMQGFIFGVGGGGGKRDPENVFALEYRNFTSSLPFHILRYLIVPPPPLKNFLFHAMVLEEIILCQPPNLIPCQIFQPYHM